MSTDRPSPAGRPEDGPNHVGAELDGVEALSGHDLHQGADTVPASGDPVSSRRRWLLSLAAVAAIAVSATGVWLSRQPTQTPPPAAQTTAPSSQATSTTGTMTSTPPATTAPPVAASTSVPVYFVGPRTRAASDTSLVLFREFTRADVATRGDAASKAKAALEQAVGVPPADSSYRRLWAGVTVGSVSVSSGLIQVTLSTGAQGLINSEGQIAVDQLVWTAQAAVNQGNLPVRFMLADGSTRLAGDLSAGQTYTRATDDVASWAILSPIWIDSPGRGQTLPAGKVTVSGVASTNEANVQWEVGRLGPPDKTVSSGHTTAAVGAPARGAYSFTTPSLPAGDYMVTVFETSMKDGSMSSVATMPFTLK